MKRWFIMRKKLKIGISYDVKEDYNISAQGFKHCDFSTLSEISIIKQSLEHRGHSVLLLGNYEKIYRMFQEKSFPNVDIVLNTAEGIVSRNREGWLPSLFEINNIPYSGSDAYTLGVTLNKVHTKIIANYLGIPTPLFYIINKIEDVTKIPDNVPQPWIIKPNYEGSSSGVTYVENASILQDVARQLLSEYHQPLLCESYIPGREFATSILYDKEKTQCIGTVEIVRKNGCNIHIFSAQDKYSSTCTKIPANLPENILKSIENDAIRIHSFLECNDYSRADFRVDSNGKYYFLELTPLPNVDPDSGFGKCCEFSNLKLGYVYEEILYNALDRFKQKQ